MFIRTLIGLLAIPVMLIAGKDCEGFLEGSEHHVQVQYKQKSRGGQVTESVNVAEVYWKPYEMLGKESCYDLTTAVLMYKPVDTDDWKATLNEQEASGLYSKWAIKDIKPCLEYQFQIQVTGPEEEALFQIPLTLGPADSESILKSGFIPDMPTDMVSNVGANSASLSWKGSDCAESYEINYIEPGSNDYVTLSIEDGKTEVVINDLKPCTHYDSTIYAILGQEYSDEKSYKIATKPRLDAVSDLEPELTPTMDSMTLRWGAWENVSCIEEYLITICSVMTSECRETEAISKPTGLPDISYETEGLSPCTDYTVEIQPIFPDTNVEPKVFPFRTLSPDADTQIVGEVTAESVTSGTMKIEWPHLNCATNYKVYANRSSSDEGWKLVSETTETSAEVDNITPCTLYRFAVTAVLDEKETEKSLTEEVVSDLDEEFAFEAPDLRVNNGDQGAELFWLHAACIESYVVKVCEPEKSDGECKEEAVIVENEEVSVSHHIQDLNPCTQYTLEIIPIITGKTFTARLNEFTTTNGIPQAPPNLEAVLSDDHEIINLSWDNVQCNTGFKIYRKEEISKEEEEEEMEIDESSRNSKLRHSFSNLIPCEKYYFAVSTLVDEQESEKTEWKEVIIPPREDLPPELKILNTENDNMTLRLDPTALNSKCKVEEYELTYGVSGASFSTVTSRVESDKDIVLSFQGASSSSAVVKGRVLYTAGDGNQAIWSAQVSSGEEIAGPIAPLESDGTTTLIPIIVGVLIAVILLALVGLVIIKKRRSRNNYDAEKAEHGKHEETQKLNDNHPDA